MNVRSRSTLALIALVATPSAAAAQIGGLFDLPTYVPGSDHGEFRGTGDFNNDGHIDLVHTTNWLDWSGITLFLGDGTGKFTPQTELAFTEAIGAEWAERDPAIGDFDGDGNLDVAFDSNSFLLTDGVVVFFGDGAGGFASTLEVPLGNYTAAIYVGESDGDASAEILAHHDDAGFQDHYTWLNWNGSGFSKSASLPIGGASDPDGAFVETLGDFDGDGDDDIAATSTSPHALVRIFPTVNGDPTYGASFNVPASMQNINHRLKAGDADGDGDIDLIHLKMFTSDPGPWVQAYENTGGGLFTQHPEENVPTPNTDWFQPHNLRLGDWNGDGWLDLFSLNIVLDVVQSDGDWTFSEGMELADISQAPGAGIHDVDGDGFVDFIGARTLHPGTGVFDATSSAIDGTTGTFPDGFTPFDLEGDGDIDLLGGVLGIRNVNNGAGSFEYDDGPGLFGGLFPSPPAVGYSYGDAVAFADFNGDGANDYLVQLNFSFSGVLGFVEMRLLVDNGLGAFADAGVAAPALVEISQPNADIDEHWEAGDADGDGDVDLFVENGYWRNNGFGFLDLFIPTSTGRVFDVADVDDDGDLDLLGVLPQPGNQNDVQIQRNDGGGTYTAVTLGSLLGSPVARFVDLDGDGDLDVAAADPEESALLLAQDEGAVFGASTTLDALVPNLRMLGIEDTNDDGTLDLLTFRYENQGLPWTIFLVTEYVRTGPGLDYTKAAEYFPSAPFGGGFEGFLDVDTDGDLDMVGGTIHLGQTIEAPHGGVTEQFGIGFPGTGGIAPLLGAAGPATSTNPAPKMHIVDAVGGGLMFLVFSPTEIAQADFPFPGMTLYVGAPTITGPYGMTGSPGAAADGTFELPLPTLPVLFGLTFIHQAFVLDPGSITGWTGSNGLRITYGD